ncbi:MAG: hypothetical protein ACLFUB_05930 [Cyclobacteriaceae bacterium]
MKKVLITLLWLCCNGLALAQSSVNELTDRFFSLYESENPRTAMLYAFDTNPYISANDDGVINLLNQLNGILEVVNSYTGYEKVSEEAVGSKLMYRTYLVYYDRQPLRFMFEFYRPRDRWVFSNVMFDTDYAEERRQKIFPQQAGR